mgnify:CR=1 FL=1
MGRKNFQRHIRQTLDKVAQDISSGNSPLYVDFNKLSHNAPSMVGTGASIFLNRNGAHSVTPDSRNVITQAPEATILVKKKAFSSLASSNNINYMDKTEKMLLRATKALFAYKVQQVRAYESLTKFETYYSKNQQYSMNLLSSFLREGRYLKLDNLQYTAEEYAQKRLDMWLDQVRDVGMQVDGGYSVYDVKTGQYIFLNESQMADVRDDGVLNNSNVEGPTARRADSGGTAFPPYTNRDYIKTLPASQAKMVLDSQKALFKGEYGKQSSGQAGFDLPVSNDMFSGNWFSDIGDALSYGAAQANYDLMMQDIASILKRNAFSADNYLTTWIVDQDSVDNYSTGPGTGVIEFTNFTDFSSSLNLNDGNANFTLEYPYRIGVVLEDDIDNAVEEAVNGTLGLLNDLANGGLRSEGMSGTMPPIDGGAIASAIMESVGLGSMDGSLDMDYVRDRMRTFYLGKPIINPPDPVHFFIRGNTAFEDFSSDDNFSASAGHSPFDKEYLEMDEIILKAEYQLYTNQGISFDQYKKIRSFQDNSFGMIHTFGGFVNSIDQRYNGGFWSLNISCSSNKNWLKWSQFATQPSMTDPKGILMDPLSPYDLTTDSLGQVISSEADLLYENKQLLQSGLLSYDDGILAGQNANEGNLFQDQFNGFGSLAGSRVMQHPSGFVYRWKKGVITATCGFTMVDPIGENTRNQETFTEQYSVTPAGDGSHAGVLNNLDMANILSVLIVGQPYNIQSFMEQAFTAQNISSRTSTTLVQTDPITSVLQTLRRQNEIYGNFKPYRMMSVSAATNEQIIANFGMRENAASQVRSLQQRKIALRSKINELNKSQESIGFSTTGIPPHSIIATLESEIETINKSIENQVSIGTKFGGAASSADQIGISIDILGGSTGLPVSGDENENHDLTRAMMLVGAQRRIEDVRLNRDRNLFIVSDQYDAADIRPFILNMNNSGNWKRFSATYDNVFQQAVAAANFLDMEFFCNTQGHLEFRPPLWNRTPLTILKESIRMQKDSGRQIMPSFITNLFQTRIETLYSQVHMLNIKLVLLSLMMGRYPDKTLIPNMTLSGPDALRFFGVKIPSSGGGFLGGLFGGGADPQTKSLSLNQREYSSSVGSITERNNELFGNGLKLTASFGNKGDILDGDTETLLGTFDVIFQEEMGVLNDILTASASAGIGGSVRPPAYDIATADNLNEIRDSFKSQFGLDPAQGTGIDAAKGFQYKDFIFKKKHEDLDSAVTGPNGILNKIKTTISQRDSYVSMLQANIANQKELEDITGVLSGELTGANDPIEVTAGSDDLINGSAVDFLESLANATSSAIDILTGSSADGTVYDHLIQDDTRNLLGYGSGKRLIITDEKLIQAGFTESPPTYTSVGVKGDAPLGMGQSLNSGADGLYFWAGATDFDMWRQYGFNSTNIDHPFLSDVEGQCRPYAMLKLALQKADINKGSITVAGNEFYQPGDTVYVEATGLLYYVDSVRHQFKYGSTFTTTLGLRYGHPPGHYLPSPLDVIGQELVGSFTDPPIVHRTGFSADDNYRPLSPNCCLVFPTGGASAVQLLAYKDNQIRFTNMMTDLSGSVVGSKYILVRGFVKDRNDMSAVNVVSQKMEVVSSMLQNPTQLAQAGGATDSDDLAEGFASSITSIGSAFGGGSIGTTRSLSQMRLPNNMPVTSIPKNKIILQTVYLDKSDESNPAGEIKCLNRELMAALSISSNEIDPQGNMGIFPKGGPSQESWLDIREALVSHGNIFTGDINAIEVGVIDIPGDILTSEIGG